MNNQVPLEEVATNSIQARYEADAYRSLSDDITAVPEEWQTLTISCDEKPVRSRDDKELPV